MKRLRELDFLRGIAIILVLFRHQYLFTFTQNMGWIGVDLFFVLSGFLVSGLLFKEYLKFGNISPANFLIRRGFKIYPIYFLFYVLYLIPIVANGRFNFIGFLSDMTFTQNYVWGWGYAYQASWSLAVEEHFYFGFTLLLWISLKNGNLKLRKSEDGGPVLDSFVRTILVLLVLCLGLRFFSNLAYPNQDVRNSSMTHLRIDSLLAGVLISYLYYFKRDLLINKFEKNKFLFALIAFLGLCWTPFIDPIPSFFTKTIGFSLLYISFGIILIYFLIQQNINKVLDKIFSAPVVNTVSKIGFCSYSIYIIHSLVNISFEYFTVHFNLYFNQYFSFIITSFVSIFIGMLMTYNIEKYFLRVRDQYFPNRAVPRAHATVQEVSVPELIAATK